MYQDTIDQFARTAATKAEAIRRNPVGFFVAAAMAGAYVGIGIILIFTIGQVIDPSLRPLVMGASFGIALTLVVFAGSELFMYGRPLRCKEKVTFWRRSGAVMYPACWCGVDDRWP